MKLILSVFCAISCSLCFADLFDDISIELRPGERISLPVSNKQIIYASNPRNVAIISLSYARQNEYTYKFRHFDRLTGKETTGNGHLMESYIRHSRKDGGFDLEDEGSQLTITAKDFAISWSFGSKTESYIYYNKDVVAIAILDADYYDKLTFLKRIPEERKENDSEL